MDGEEKMKATAKTSGIGRRRGASKKKSLQTSVLVSVVAFCVTCFVILGLYLNFMSPSQQVQLQVTNKIYEDAPFIHSTRNFLKKRHEHDFEKETPYDADETWGPILRAEVHLFDLALGKFGPSSTKPGGYDGVRAKFCKLKWGLHKNDPPKYPMFRFLVSSFVPS